MEEEKQNNSNELGFLKWLEANSLSPRTIKEYKYYLSRFGSNPYNQECVNKFILKNKNNVARAFIKNLREYLLELDGLSDEEKAKINSVHIRRKRGDRTVHKEKKVITLEEFKRMEAAVKPLQIKLMLNLSYYCALRSFELLNVNANCFNWKDWELDESKNGRITILGKRNKLRTVLVPPFVMVQARDYFMMRYANKNIPFDKKIWSQSWSCWFRLVDRISKNVLKTHISTHVFRRSFATHLFEQGWDLLEIKEHLGHANVSTTSIYTQISKKHLDDKFSKIIG